jgi:hypothetical protein
MQPPAKSRLIRLKAGIQLLVAVVAVGSRTTGDVVSEPETGDIDWLTILRLAGTGWTADPDSTRRDLLRSSGSPD